MRTQCNVVFKLNNSNFNILKLEFTYTYRHIILSSVADRQKLQILSTYIYLIL